MESLSFEGEGGSYLPTPIPRILDSKSPKLVHTAVVGGRERVKGDP